MQSLSMRICHPAVRAVLLTAVLAVGGPAPAQDVPVAGRIPDVGVRGEPRPAPRLPDGHPDLGNGKGAWNPRVIANLSGAGRGGSQRSPVEQRVDIPMQPWALDLYNQ